jgi:hypothetical protein
MLKYLLQARVNGGDWKTSSVADTREKAAMAATRVILELTRNGHRRIAIRVVPDCDAVAGGAR